MSTGHNQFNVPRKSIANQGTDIFSWKNRQYLSFVVNVAARIYRIWQTDAIHRMSLTKQFLRRPVFLCGNMIFIHQVGFALCSHCTNKVQANTRYQQLVVDYITSMNANTHNVQRDNTQDTPSSTHRFDRSAQCNRAENEECYPISKARGGGCWWRRHFTDCCLWWLFVCFLFFGLCFLKMAGITRRLFGTSKKYWCLYDTYYAQERVKPKLLLALLVCITTASLLCLSRTSWIWWSSNLPQCSVSTLTSKIAK